MMSHSFRLIPREIVVAIVATIVLGAIPYAVSASELPDEQSDVVQYGNTGRFPGLELKVINVDANAEALLHTFDPTMPYVTDIAYVMIQVEARNTDKSAVVPADVMSFTLMLDVNHSYDLETSGCDRWPMPPGAMAIAPGATARFNLCFITPLWLPLDHQDQLIVQTLAFDDIWPLFFALNVPQQDCDCVQPTPKPTCACVDPTSQDRGMSRT